MTFPTVIETPLPLEPVTRDPFADVSPAEATASNGTPAAVAMHRPALAAQSA